MATTDFKSYEHRLQASPPSSAHLYYEEAITLANGDIVRFLKLPPYHHVLNAGVNYAELDTNVSPTGTASLQLYDGSSATDIITDFDLGAPQIIDGAANGLAGWMGTYIDDADWLLRLEVTAALATAAEASLGFYVVLGVAIVGNDTLAGL